MKRKLFIVVLLSYCSFCSAQQKANWDKWKPLIGEWQGEGYGKPGKGGGKFSFYPDLNDNILVRKSHSEYPAGDNKPATVHDDMMVIYPDVESNPAKAIYFDNEGHVIQYAITYDKTGIVLTSSKQPHAPIFRLSYNFSDDKTVDTKFEVSQDGEKFTTYIEGKSTKVQ